KERTKNSLFDADRVERKIHDQHLFKSRRYRYARELQDNTQQQQQQQHHAL
ncbi:MAG: hypothetical protein ACI8RD_013757, partial [Bacillariaceae sp.]